MIKSYQKWATVPEQNLKKDLFLTKEDGKEVRLLYFVHTQVQKSGWTTQLRFPRQRTTKMLRRGMVYKANDPKNCSVEWVTEHYTAGLFWVLSSRGGSRLNLFPTQTWCITFIYNIVNTQFRWIKKIYLYNKKAILLGFQYKQKSSPQLSYLASKNYTTMKTTYWDTSFMFIWLQILHSKSKQICHTVRFICQSYLAAFLEILHR